jgi:hypothetical protein
MLTTMAFVLAYEFQAILRGIVRENASALGVHMKGSAGGASGGGLISPVCKSTRIEK